MYSVRALMVAADGSRSVRWFECCCRETSVYISCCCHNHGTHVFCAAPVTGAVCVSGRSLPGHGLCLFCRVTKQSRKLKESARQQFTAGRQRGAQITFRLRATEMCWSGLFAFRSLSSVQKPHRYKDETMIMNWIIFDQRLKECKYGFNRIVAGYSYRYR
jgi:hypothetical protein